MEQLSDVLRMLQVLLGIGLVIFVHEAGHFLAARLCKVRVDVFSIGFGPALLRWKRGDTTYQLSALPLGGYVRMAGEDAYLDTGKGGERVPDPGELGSKSVGQRFFIYSGGVLMNLAFGFLVFPVLFSVGVPFLRPVLGESVPGGPAWEAGLAPGSRVVAVNGKEVYDFLHVPTAVALGDPESVELELLPPGATETVVVVLTPEVNEAVGLSTIGVSPGIDPNWTLAIEPESPAATAGLEDGDRLLAIVGGAPGLSLLEQFRVATQDGGPVEVRVLRPVPGSGAGSELGAGEELTVRIEPDLSRQSPPLLGVEPPSNLVLHARDTDTRRASGLERGDRLLSLGGRAIERLGDLEAALLSDLGPLAALVVRDGRERSLELPAADEALRLALASDLALSFEPERTEVLVRSGSPADVAGLLDGDRVLRVDGERVEGWRALQAAVSEVAQAGRPAQLSVERLVGGEPRVLTFEVAPEPRPMPFYGLNPLQDEYVYRADGPLHAVKVGVACSWRFASETWLTLRSMAVGRVGTDQIGGIITIGAVSYSWAEQGWTKLFFFLCMLSINLAILNVLPIPVLDGGHLFFLLIEKLKGSPVSDRVLGYSQMVGMVLILSLMVYVIYNDVNRWFLGG